MMRLTSRGHVLTEALAGLGGMSVGILASVIAQTTIGPDSYVNLGTVVGICGGILWLNVTLTKIQNRLKSIESAKHETWTWNAMRAWTSDLREANPSLDIPKPERPLWADAKEKE